MIYFGMGTVRARPRMTRTYTVSPTTPATTPAPATLDQSVCPVGCPVVFNSCTNVGLVSPSASTNNPPTTKNVNTAQPQNRRDCAGVASSAAVLGANDASV